MEKSIKLLSVFGIIFLSKFFIVKGMAVPEVSATGQNLQLVAIAFLNIALTAILLIVPFLVGFAISKNHSLPLWHTAALTAIITIFLLEITPGHFKLLIVLCNIGLLLGYLFAKGISKDWEKAGKSTKYSTYLAAAVLAVIYDPNAELTEYALKILNIKKDGVYIKISKSEYDKNFSIYKDNLDNICRASKSEVFIGKVDVIGSMGGKSTVQIKRNDADHKFYSIPTGEELIPYVTENPCKNAKRKTNPTEDIVIFFELHSWKINKNGKEILSSKVNEIALGDFEKITIIGFADDIPSTNPDNANLSLKRAIEVKKWLISKNPEVGSRIIAAGAGPVDECNKRTAVDFCREENRRVEVVMN